MEFPPVFIFQLASQHGEWLAARQSLTAANIANVDTPGYKARDVSPFEAVFERTQLELSTTNANHMPEPGDRFTSAGLERESAWDVTYSGNNVGLEAELLKVSENGRMQALDTGLTKVFHRMILTSLKA
jgi:flagellar basal-body rod protein FlgB